MIVSASYRTDIPAFYGEWFINRLRAGFCRYNNPYNSQVCTVSLARADVDGFVFWTKNAGPFLPRFAEVRERGFPFTVQYTINGYPRALEHSVVDAAKSVEHARRIADEYGPRVVVWRYDTIVHSSLTSHEFHVANFERLATALAGVTDEVVVSFAQIYRKSRINMDAAARLYDFTWSDPEQNKKASLAGELADIARTHDMRFTVCSQRVFLEPGRIEDARCIDADRLAAVAGYPIRGALRGNRPECGCHESRDIGEYDTCPHGCVYCYAVRNRALAQRRYRAHDANSEFLFA
ncbi:MAG TPA: DUF1848 domain-containing protein [Bryobacteraceae bacterium]|nr:DUF1848 domain-containing protein [Bryobacteraceae bacterium]